jgi:predicted MPP superfamily phosphohydrolase
MGIFKKAKDEAEFPIKIGLMADSQITSRNGFSDFHYRSKMADALVDVSIRPPALECCLATEMLQTALDKLTRDTEGGRTGVDVILYLGDAANSGGTDEIETVLRILSQCRQQTGIPIFIIIGNHDYLGAGNIVTPGIRFAILNQIGHPDNPALTKYEVLKKFSDFNRGNQNLPAAARFQYIDNAEALEQNKNLDHRTGLYLSGAVMYREEGKDPVDIFLLDSSDYKDCPDWSEVIKLGFYGIIGSVSFKDEPGYVSQTSYLKTIAQSSSPKFRFLASHYPKDHLDRITFAKPGQVPLNITNLAWGVTESAFNIPTFAKTLNQNLEPLLISGERNYWICGHTHVGKMLRPERYIIGGLTAEKYFRAINVGSTTDYRAHVAIVERYEQNNNDRMDNFVGYREIPLFDGNPDLLSSIPKAIEEYGRQNVQDPVLGPLIPTREAWTRKAQSGGLLDIPGALLSGLQKSGPGSGIDPYWMDVGATFLGLNKMYQEEAWKDPETEVAVRHLKTFVEDFLTRTGSDRGQMIACLGLLSGAYEKGILPAKCDFGPESMKKLCAEPK